MPAPSSRTTSTRRLTLRPGVHVLRRDPGHLQVGLDPARAVVLADTPEVREVLGALHTPDRLVDRAHLAGATLELLDQHGLLVDLDRLLPHMPTGPAPSPTDATVPARSCGSRAGVAALAAYAGDETEELLARRARTGVELLVSGGPEAEPFAGSVTALLAAVGITHVVRPEPGHDDPGAEAQVGLLVSVGEPPRELVDPWLRAGTPHLVLRLVEGRAVVGPFVDPGQTACLRCVDHHHTDVDPGWPLLVVQHASAAAHPRPDTLPEPVDPALAALAAGWAVREVTSHVEGRPPGTSSTTVRLDPHLTEIETDCWPRHPGCGCAWP